MANEKRLIDADELLSVIHQYDEKQQSDVWLTEEIEYLLAEQPTVDAVEVVRCKDCKWYDADCETCVYLSEDGDTYDCGCDVNMKPDDFCSYGERKDDERKAD